MLQTQTVTPDTLALIKKLMADIRLNEFVLVGGTALALQIGHRLSVDIDLFSPNAFDAPVLLEHLKTDYNAERYRTLQNGIFCFIDGIKIDMISHPYPEVNPHQVIDGIRLMSKEDIAAMKLHSIVMSGQRLKDFTDVYFLLEHMPLSRMYQAYEKKYYPHSSDGVARRALNDTSGVNINDPLSLTNRPFDWDVIKTRLTDAMQSKDMVYEPTEQNEETKQGKEKRRKRGLRM